MIRLHLSRSSLYSLCFAVAIVIVTLVVESKNLYASVSATSSHTKVQPVVSICTNSTPGNTKPVVTKTIINALSQTVKIYASSTGYSPNVITVKKGIPLSLTISTQGNINECEKTFSIPQLGIVKDVATNTDTVIHLPAMTQSSSVIFTCSTGLYSGKFVVN